MKKLFLFFTFCSIFNFVVAKKLQPHPTDDQVVNEALFYKNLRVYIHLLRLQSMYEDAKLTQPTNYFAIENELIQIKDACSLLKEVVNKLCEVEVSFPEIGASLIALFTSYYNFIDPDNKEWKAANLFTKFSSEIREILDDELQETVAQNPSIKKLLSLKKNLCALNTLIGYRIQQGVLHLKCAPYSTLQYLKKALQSFAPTVDATFSKIPHSKTTSWWTTFKDDPGTYLLPALLAIVGVIGIFQHKPFKRSSANFQPRQSYEKKGLAQLPLVGYAGSSIPVTEKGPSRKIDEEIWEEEKDNAPKRSSLDDIIIPMEEQSSSNIEEKDVLMLDPESYSAYEKDIKKYPQSISSKTIFAEESLGKHKTALMRVSFTNLHDKNIKKLYKIVRLLALNKY